MRRFVALPVLAIAAAVIAVAPATPAGAAITAKPWVVPKALSNVPTSARMVAAGGHIFISTGSGNSIQVYSLSGNKLPAITGEPGAKGMVVSPDGKKVYVALSATNAIDVFNASQATFVKRLTVTSGTCPAYVAMSAGRVFYGYGACGTGTDIGVASIDTAGTTVVPALTGQSVIPQVAGTSSKLVVGLPGSPDTVTAYDTSVGDGSLGSSTSENTTSQLTDLTVSELDNRVFVAGANGTAVHSFSLSNLANASTTYPGPAGEQTVAISPDGTKVATGFNTSGDTVNLYSKSGSALWKRFATSSITSTGSWDQPLATVLPGGATFSPDGSLVYALVSTGTGVSMFVSVLAPKASSVSVTAPNIAYKGSGTASAKASGGNKLAVQFFRETKNNLLAPKSLGVDVTNSSHIAKMSFSAPYSGRIRAIVLGNPAVLPSTSTDSFTVGSKSTIKMTGSYKKSGGVQYYHSYSDVLGTIKVLSPIPGRSFTTSLQAKEGGKWVNVQTFTAYTDGTGKATFSMSSATANVLYRQTMKFSGDAYNRGSQATGTVFTIA